MPIQNLTYIMSRYQKNIYYIIDNGRDVIYVCVNVFLQISRRLDYNFLVFLKEY